MGAEGRANIPRGAGGRKHARSRGELRGLAIVTANEADFEGMSMLGLKAEGGLRGYGVLRTIDQACVWLGNAACA